MYQCDVWRLTLGGRAPSFSVNEACSYGPKYDADKHRRKSLAKVPYLLDLDCTKTVQDREGA